MNIALHGMGKMGQAVAALLADMPQHHISARFDIDHPIQAGQLAGVDVLIDFSSAEALAKAWPVALDAGVAMVSGTTNWESDLPKLKAAVLERGGAFLFAPNFSIGVMLYRRMVAEAARLAAAFPEFDISLHEVHHRFKTDSPSGTAKMLAQVILEQHPGKDCVMSPDAATGALPANALSVSAQRVGHVPGTHSVLIDSPADSISLTHTARSRSGFASGAIKAAEWIQDKKGFFSLEHLLDDLTSTKQ